jgi:uridylate kinase
MKTAEQPKFTRVLIKISGEALTGGKNTTHDPSFCSYLAEEIAVVHKNGVQVAIVCGGGNIFRGAAGVDAGVDRVHGDYIGMLATIINAVVLGQYLNRAGCPTRILSPIAIPQLSEMPSVRTAVTALTEGDVILFAGGTGNPFFTTDSAAVLRALESECQVVLKATKVDGIYDSDPALNPSATFIPHLSYQEAIERNLQVMDQTAFAMCQDNNMPIIVFNIHQAGNIRRAAQGEAIGSLVDSEGRE